MKQKNMTFFKCFVGILLILALFFSDINQWLFIGILIFGLVGTLLLTLWPHIQLPKYVKHGKRKKPSSVPDEGDPVKAALLCQFSHRITDKLRSAYPEAVWDWESRPDTRKLLSGEVVRIQLLQAGEFTHAEVKLDVYGGIHLGLLKIQKLNKDTAASKKPSEPPVDCNSWYELVGSKVLSQVITDLNARGYTRLSINEKGDVFITEKDNTPVVKERFQNFPGKKHWEELISIFKENELDAAATDTALVLSWEN